MYKKKFEKVGIRIPNILFPNENIDLKKFSVIACDQFTSNKEYWDEVKKIVSGHKSSMDLIFPEIDLPITSEKINTINNNMKKYIDENILTSIGETFIYVNRETTSGIRQGLIVSLDLEQYDYRDNAKTLIRATEKTVADRLPARVDIKRGACLDIPHVMVLINDEENLLMNALKKMSLGKKTLYDFDLMMQGGNIKGYKVDEENDLNEIADIFIKLYNNAKDKLLYAIGDGNHSLAAAKIIYEDLKRKIAKNNDFDLNNDENREKVLKILENEQKRYALVEIVNIFDEGLEFYPIHRLLINVDRKKFFEETKIDMNEDLDMQKTQLIIDEYLKNHSETKLEYIHDIDECKKLGNDNKNLSLIFKEFKKNGFFDDIIKYGSLCRKSFSMGEGRDKRYYLESRKI